MSVASRHISFASDTTFIPVRLSAKDDTERSFKGNTYGPQQLRTCPNLMLVFSAD